MNETKQYIVSFLITQRGEHTQWIDEVLSSGLRDGETLDSLCITELDMSDGEMV
jgi:hypothetical protein